MELIKKNIHMDRMKCKAVTQIALEDDINIPDVKPDVSALNFEKGKIQIDEIKPSEDNVNVKGRLQFWVLYQSKEEGGQLAVVEGKLPFEEKIYLKGVMATDTVEVSTELEDLNISIINSRKLNVQALVTLKPFVEELYDEDTTVDVYQDTPMEYYKKKMDIVQIAIQKNDIFRIREEVELPQSYPNIFEILWDSVTLGEVEFKTLEEKISVQGELNLFILYEGEGEESPIRTFETTIPFSGVIECHGSREQMIGDIRYEIGSQELDIRPDFDGEERMLGLEVVLDIVMKLYEEDSVEVLSDIYGVTKEVSTETKNAEYRRLLMKNMGKSKVADRIRIKNSGAGILQLLHSEGNALIESQSLTPDGIVITGTLNVQVMYITSDDTMPYQAARGLIPFTYTLDAPGIKAEDSFRVQVEVEQLQVTMLDSEELDVKAVLCFKTTVFQTIHQVIITDISIRDVDVAKMNELPGMIIYIVKKGDSLWSIGKKYYVSVEQIKELNGLTGDEIMPGDKLLIVRGN